MAEKARYSYPGHEHPSAGLVVDLFLLERVKHPEKFNSSMDHLRVWTKDVSRLVWKSTEKPPFLDEDHEDNAYADAIFQMYSCNKDDVAKGITLGRRLRRRVNAHNMDNDQLKREYKSIVENEFEGNLGKKVGELGLQCGFVFEGRSNPPVEVFRGQKLT